MITVTIKGTRQDAIRALRARSLLDHAEGTPDGFRELHVDLGGILTQVHIIDTHLDAVVAWFTEMAIAPYPVGTVLLFTRVQE